jgi:pimeloyl-ACP methyl ester carboxylesterase
MTPQHGNTDLTSSSFNLTSVGFETTDVATPSGTMRLFRAGDGPPLVLLHGIGGGASSYYWARLAPLLTPHFTVYAPDLVGWGDSDHPARALQFDDYVAQVLALLEAVPPPAAIIAQSLAAGFVTAALRRRPAHDTPKLILLSPTGGKDFGEDSFPPLARWTLSVLARSPGVNALVYRLIFHREAIYRSWFSKNGFLNPDLVPGDLVQAGLESGRKPNAAYSALPFVGGSLRYDIAPLLNEIDIRTLELWGDHENLIAPMVRFRLGELNKQHIEVRTIPNCRTSFENEAPNATAEAMFQFLINEPN